MLGDSSVPPRDAAVPPWTEAAHKEWEAERMAVYAAQIDCLDQNIGRLLDTLKKIGREENTIVIFLSDNGGDAPIPNDKQKPVVSGNAPLRGKKAMRYEGGILVTMIGAW